MDPHDPLIQLRAELDQAIAAAPELARALHGQFKAYVAEGFSEQQALYLLIANLHGNPGPAPK